MGNLDLQETILLTLAFGSTFAVCWMILADLYTEWQDIQDIDDYPGADHE